MAKKRIKPTDFMVMSKDGDTLFQHIDRDIAERKAQELAARRKERVELHERYGRKEPWEKAYSIYPEDVKPLPDSGDMQAARACWALLQHRNITVDDFDDLEELVQEAVAVSKRTKTEDEAIDAMMCES